MLSEKMGPHVRALYKQCHVLMACRHAFNHQLARDRHRDYELVRVREKDTVEPQMEEKKRAGIVQDLNL